MPLVLEIDRQTLLDLGDAIQQTVYNAATAALQQAVEDFATAQDGEEDDDGDDDGDDDEVVDDRAGDKALVADCGGSLPAALTRVTNDTGRAVPVLEPGQLPDQDSR